MSDFQLTEENYYSAEADKIYRSVSQLKSMEALCSGIHGCEQRELAKLRGEYVEPPSDALLIGSAVDAMLESPEAYEKWKVDHPECVSSRGASKGQLKTQFVHAEEMVARVKRDPLFMLMLSGEKQKIVTGEIGGEKFKAKLDSYVDGAEAEKLIHDPEWIAQFECLKDENVYKEILDVFYRNKLDEGHYIVDLKTSSNFRKLYNVKDSGVQNFTEFWGYDIQLMVYQELVRQMTGELCKTFIAVVSKEPVPDLKVIEVHPVAGLMDTVAHAAKRVGQVVRGEIPDFMLSSCGVCDYCKESKVLTSIGSSDYMDIEYD